MVLNTLIVPEAVKEELRKPIGKVYSSIEKITIPKGFKLITVGDRVSFAAITAGLNPYIIVYDGKEKREFVSSDMRGILDKYPAFQITVSNPPGKITKELWETVKRCFPIKEKIKIFVIGEEDLAAFPLVLEAPKNTIILYGLADKGIVFVEINENTKNKWRELLKQMKGL